MPAVYSRRNPSARYRRLLELYDEMHTRGEAIRGIAPEHTFAGTSLQPQAHHIRRLAAQTGARSILDYGSGKGAQYRGERTQQYWRVERIVCYDPAYVPFSRLPEGNFDGVICTDVLEHCPEEDLDWIVDELLAFATKFVFASIACRPAQKRLPNGENAHCTVRPPEYWQALFARRQSKLVWELRFA